MKVVEIKETDGAVKVMVEFDSEYGYVTLRPEQLTDELIRKLEEQRIAVVDFSR